MLEKLLLAVDESEHSRKAVPATVELARAGGGSVHVSACPVLVVRVKEILEERHHDVLRAQTRFQS